MLLCWCLSTRTLGELPPVVDGGSVMDGCCLLLFSAENVAAMTWPLYIFGLFSNLQRCGFSGLSSVVCLLQPSGRLQSQNNQCSYNPSLKWAQLPFYPQKLLFKFFWNRLLEKFCSSPGRVLLQRGTTFCIIIGNRKSLFLGDATLELPASSKLNSLVILVS